MVLCQFIHPLGHACNPSYLDDFTSNILVIHFYCTSSSSIVCKQRYLTINVKSDVINDAFIETTVVHIFALVEGIRIGSCTRSKILCLQYKQKDEIE